MQASHGSQLGRLISSTVCTWNIIENFNMCQNFKNNACFICSSGWEIQAVVQPSPKFEVKANSIVKYVISSFAIPFGYDNTSCLNQHSDGTSTFILTSSFHLHIFKWGNFNSCHIPNVKLYFKWSLHVLENIFTGVEFCKTCRVCFDMPEWVRYTVQV